MKLWWHPFSVFPRRVRIALREKDLPARRPSSISPVAR